MLALFHLSIVVYNCFTIWFDQMYVDLPFPSDHFAALPFKARGMFLTVWCLVLQTIYFAISFLNDMIGTNAAKPRNPPLIRKIKDILFSLAFTTAVYVSIAFWGLYFLNKDYIFPDDIAAKFPNWMNHTMHTIITPLILIELFVTKRNYPSRNLGIALAILFNVVYLGFPLTAYLQTGIWVYPFLNVISLSMQILYFSTSAVIGILVYILGETLDRISNSKSAIYSNGNVKKR